MALVLSQVQFSPDGRWIATASFDKAVKLWDGLKGSFVATLRAHVGPVYQLAWSSDSRLLVSGSKDSTLKVGGRSCHHHLCLLRCSAPCEGGLLHVDILPSDLDTTAAFW